MPNNIEIRPKEIFKNAENWRRWFLTMLLIGFLSVASQDVDASDADTIYDQNQKIEFSIGSVEAFYASLGGDFDVEQQANPEIEPIQVTIPSSVNVRSLDNATTIPGFPRGNANVIGSFNATAADNFGRAAVGTWLVVEKDGQTGAVFSSLVSEVDGTPVTTSELTASQTPVFSIEEGVPTPPAPEPEEEQPTAEPTGDGSNEDGVEIARAPLAPEGLFVPEVPSSITFSTRTLMEIYDGEPGSRPETINVNQDNLLAMPLGLIEEGDFEITDSVSVWEEGSRSSEAWKRIPMSGIILSVDQDPGTNVYLITLRTATQNGTPFTALVRVEGIMRFSPVNDQLGLMISQEEADTFAQVSSTFSNDRITAPTRNLLPGDHITITIFDVAEAHNNPLGITYRVNSHVNEVSDGTPSNIFREIDRGNIDPDEAIVYAAATGTIIYNQD